MSESIEDFITYKFDGTIASLDFTGLLKGLAMQVISNSIKSDKFLISFGHDIYARNWDKITIKITNKFSIEAQDSFVCFTSGNNKERGDHIRVVSSINSSITSATYYKQLINSNNYLECIIADMKATKHFSTQANDEHIYFTDNSTGKLVFTEKVYCASPFFCDYDRAVRDKMIEAIPKHLVFRPDATKSSKKFSKVLAKGQSKKNAKVALKVFKDNVDHISRSDILVFPKYTNDLGTLMEVGIALGRVKILRYNYLNDTYTKVCDYLDNISIDTSTMYSFTDKVRQKGVLLGFDYSTNSGDRDIYYHLAGNPDNIMLSESSIRYDKCDDKYVKVSTTYVEGM
jgi:nucleoside 2-deoxyribosyltransferase